MFHENKKLFQVNILTVDGIEAEEGRTTDQRTTTEKWYLMNQTGSIHAFPPPHC